MMFHGNGKLRLARTAGSILLSALIAVPSAYAGTYLPQCYKPGPGTPKTLKYEARRGPYRIALVNSYTGIPWREQMIKSVKIWSARPEIASQLKELKIVSTGSDV